MNLKKKGYLHLGKCLTVGSGDLNLVWKTKKVRPFFPVKDKNLDPPCKVYYGLCSYGEDYVGETIRNVFVHYEEHNKPSKKLKPVARLEKNIDHWRILGNAPPNARTPKIIEVVFIAITRPILHEQIDCDALNLFRNGVN